MLLLTLLPSRRLNTNGNISIGPAITTGAIDRKLPYFLRSFQFLNLYNVI